jgi:hypothetical protein
MYGAWIEIRRERNRPASQIDPLIEMIYQHKPISRRLSRDQQQRMVPPRIGAGHSARREPSPPVCFKPFQTQGSIKVLAIRLLNLHLPSPSHRRHGLSSFPCALCFHPPDPGRAETRPFHGSTARNFNIL